MNNLFTEALKQLSTQLTAMGNTVSDQIFKATQSYIDHDKAEAQALIQHDQSINSSEVDLEKQALTLMTLQQPVADDFRNVITILKSSADLERIGDHATSIARETIRVKGTHRIDEIEAQLAVLSKLIRNMLADALAASEARDPDKAKTIAARDIEVDRQFDAIRQAVISAMQQDTNVAQAGTSYLFVVKLLERIGDRIVNLAEEVVYDQTGEIIELNQGRHTEDE